MKHFFHVFEIVIHIKSFIAVYKTVRIEEEPARTLGWVSSIKEINHASFCESLNECTDDCGFDSKNYDKVLRDSSKILIIYLKYVH